MYWIIEDEPLLALELEIILEELGFVVCATAATEDAAVEAALRHRPDLITADVQLKKGCGIRAVERITEDHSACVIFVTGDWQMVEARVVDGLCVRKPFNAQSIAQAVETGLARLAKSPPIDSAGLAEGAE